MKKSNTLMLSYMIFLALTILAQLFFKWDGLDRIAVAATTAGCFFAFGDLANWYTSYQIPVVNALEKDFDNLVGYSNAALSLVASQGKELVDTITLVSPYKDDFSSVGKIIEYSEDLIKWNNDREKNVIEASKKCDKIKLLLDTEREKLKRINNIEIVFVTIGFLAFFFLISFKKIFSFIVPFQDIATVLAFIVIMLNYFLRDVLEEKSKHEIDVILDRVKSEQKEIEQMIEKSKQTPILDKVKSVVEGIQHLEENKKEEKDNG